MDLRVREEERLRLQHAIQEWNSSRMDLFEISDPDSKLEFHGVMRFFFQDATDKSSNSKCIRVSSTATNRDVINTLIMKFHPDMRMLSTPDYALYELQRDQDDRKLRDEERPLYVQLNWTSDMKEERFLLQQVNDPTMVEFYKDDPFEKNSDKRLSKREKKELKKERKLAQQRGETKAYDAWAKSNFTLPSQKGPFQTRRMCCDESASRNFTRWRSSRADQNQMQFSDSRGLSKREKKEVKKERKLAQQREQAFQDEYH